MIKYIKEEPKVRRVFILLVCTSAFLYVCFGIFQVRQLNNIHKNQIKIFQRLVGTIVDDYPQKEEEIVEALFSNENDKHQLLGETVLKKYGYDLEIEMANDNKFLSYRSNLIKINIIVLGILLVVNILMMFIMSKNMFLYLDRVYEVINNFIKGDYNNWEYELSNGIVSRVNNRLYQLGNAINLKQNKLEQEKENSKALVTDISHQLKTPLASLKMCNSILLEDDLTKEERIEFLQSSEVGIKKLEYLVDSLVNISRLEADMIKMKPIRASIKNTITQAVKNIYIKALDKSIIIGLNEFNDIEIVHDYRWTEEAIFNILENAVKYTDIGGEITIIVSETVNYLKIEIKDNGIGINKDEFSNIFKRFYRGKLKDIKNIEGSGVGLYLSRKIIEEQGGSVMVASNVGVGSKFSILLKKD